MGHYTRTKRPEASRAEDLYVSPLSGKCRQSAQHRFRKWYILSAKHGLLEPDRKVGPYDKRLKEVTRDGRRGWAGHVFRELRRRAKCDEPVTFLAGRDYREFLVPLLLAGGYNVNVPLEGLSIGRQLRWLNRVNRQPERLAHLDEFYGLLSRLERAVGGARALGECHGRMDWPDRGVYFLFEPGEMRTIEPNVQRVVRVGTHMVSRGCQAKLWSRLRTHRGTTAGGGNHRGSILRLHVGAAMLAKAGTGGSVPTWGKGQTAAQDTRALEANLEQDVSHYIGRMHVLWLAIGDGPGPSSDRAYIERNTIGLLCGPSGPVDLPRKQWLGNWSVSAPIRQSGLWNVDHIDHSYDPRFLAVFRTYVDAALDHSAGPEHSVAPRDWHIAAEGKSAQG